MMRLSLHGTTMKDQLRFAMAFWHTMCGGGRDPFGDPTAERPWNSVSDPMEAARMRMRGIFELTEKLSMPFFCFHDRDIAPEGDTLRETNKNLDEIVALAKELMKTSPTQTALGHGQPFRQPALHARRRDEPASRRSSPMPRPRSRRPSRSPRSSAARTTSSGAAARATRPCSTRT